MDLRQLREEIAATPRDGWRVLPFGDGDGGAAGGSGGRAVLTVDVDISLEWSDELIDVFYRGAMVDRLPVSAADLDWERDIVRVVSDLKEHHT